MEKNNNYIPYQHDPPPIFILLGKLSMESIIVTSTFSSYLSKYLFFFQCLSDGTWKSKTCAEGGMFDYKKGYCVQAENASCHPLCPEDLNCERQVPCSINQVIVPDPFDCQKFYQVR